MITVKKIILFLTIILFFFLSGCGLYYYDFHEYENGTEIDNGSSFTVKEVIDGDTIVLSNDRKIRLIGINTPEQGMYFFKEAREILEIMILGREVVLEKDISELDKYGRLLRYVYAGDLFINLEMVARGFANAYTYPPDVRYNEIFLEAERQARLDNLGLWEKSKAGAVNIDLNYDADGNDNLNLNDEYAVIENTGTGSVNIYGWTVKDSGTSIYKFGRYCLEPGSIIYLYTGSGSDGEGRFYWNSPRPIWNNDHDTLYLRDREGLLVEIYNY